MVPSNKSTRTVVINCPRDKHGIVISPGKLVKCPTGQMATIVFENYALRFLIDGLENLKKNGSLVFCERWKPYNFEVINNQLKEVI